MGCFVVIPSRSTWKPSATPNIKKKINPRTVQNGFPEAPKPPLEAPRSIKMASKSQDIAPRAIFSAQKCYYSMSLTAKVNGWQAARLQKSMVGRVLERIVSDFWSILKSKITLIVFSMRLLRIRKNIKNRGRFASKWCVAGSEVYENSARKVSLDMKKRSAVPIGTQRVHNPSGRQP